MRRSLIITCPVCGSHSELLTPVQAAALAQVELPRIYRWLAEGSLHAATISSGDQRICTNSLFLISGHS